MRVPDANSGMRATFLLQLQKSSEMNVAPRVGIKLACTSILARW